MVSKIQKYAISNLTTVRQTFLCEYINFADKTISPLRDFTPHVLGVVANVHYVIRPATIDEKEGDGGPHVRGMVAADQMEMFFRNTGYQSHP